MILVPWIQDGHVDRWLLRQCVDRSVASVPSFSLYVWLELNVNTSSVIMVDMNYYSEEHIGHGFGVTDPSLFLYDDVY